MRPANPNFQSYILAALGAVVVVATIVWFTSGVSERPSTAEQPKSETPSTAPPPAASPAPPALKRQASTG